MTKASTTFVALDLGTSKFCLAAFNLGQRGLPLSLETISMAAGGMRRGMVANLALAKEKLALLIETAEKKLGTDINSVLVGIAGSHVSSRNIRTALPLNDDAVSVLHLSQLMALANDKFKTEGREILHVIPMEYRVDDRPPTHSPIGLSGKHLNGTFLLIEASRAYLRDVISLCNSCGLEVRRFIAEPYASAVVSTSEEERSLGVAVCDIGGGTTDGMVYLAGASFSAFTLNIAGHLMTNDLSLGLNLPFDEAERLKITVGLETNQERGTFVEAVDIKGRSVKVARENIVRILRARILELATMIAQEIRPYRGSLGAGLILTGGGSEVLGMASLLERALGIPVSLSLPRINLPERQRDQNSNPLASHPTKLATALGMLQIEIMSQSQTRDAKFSDRSTRYLSRIVHWLKEFS